MDKLTRFTKEELACPKCGKVHLCDRYSVINVTEKPELKEKDITGWTLISQVDFISGAFRKFGLLGKSDVWLLEFKLFVEVQPGTIRIFSDKPVSFFDGVLDDIIEEIKKLC